MEKRKFRVAVLNSHPIQYFAPLYSYLNRSDNLDTVALYCTNYSLRGSNDPGFGRAVKWDIDLLAGYDAVFLGERAKVRSLGGFFSLVAPEVWGEIRSRKYDFLWLHGHSYAANILALIAAKSRRIPVLMRGETHLGLQRSGLKRFLRRLLIGGLYKCCDGFLAIGSANRDFYLAMGVPAKKIFLVPYTVDNARFMAASNLNAGEIDRVRASLGVKSDHPVILFASKFMDRKRPADLIRAAHNLRSAGRQFTLVMVGTGELSAELRELVTTLDLQDSVIFPGFFNQSELPAVYAACDVFVLPSENEPWGLVVNEVMCAGKPIVTTEDVGCARDLVAHEVNGFVYRAGDISGLTDALTNLIDSPSLRLQMGQRSLERISSWSYAQCVEGVAMAVRQLSSTKGAI